MPTRSQLGGERHPKRTKAGHVFCTSSAFLTESQAVIGHGLLPCICHHTLLCNSDWWAGYMMWRLNPTLYARRGGLGGHIASPCHLFLTKRKLSAAKWNFNIGGVRIGNTPLAWAQYVCSPTSVVSQTFSREAVWVRSMQLLCKLVIWNNASASTPEKSLSTAVSAASMVYRSLVFGCPFELW